MSCSSCSFFSRNARDSSINTSPVLAWTRFLFPLEFYLAILSTSDTSGDNVVNVAFLKKIFLEQYNHSAKIIWYTVCLKSKVHVTDVYGHESLFRFIR